MTLDLKATQFTEPGDGLPLLVVGPSIGTSVTALWSSCAALLAGRLLLGAGFVAAIGFFLTGIADLAGNGAVKLLAAQNPDLERGAYLAASISRIVYNCMAQVGLGWFAWQLSWCGLKTGLLPKGFCRFGYLSGLSGLVMGVIFFPVYLQLVLIWAGWLAVIMWRQAGRTPA